MLQGTSCSFLHAVTQAALDAAVASQRSFFRAMPISYAAVIWHKVTLDSGMLVTGSQP
jgi:hypothetical protein